ncbi:hypothetical protein R6Z07M_002555 [Ovis aries]
MTYRCLLQMVLLLCLSTTALCRSYSLLRFQQGRSLEVCQNLLWQLPSTPQHCLEFRMDFQMPEEMKQAQQFRKEDAVLVMYEMLQHIFNILTRDFSSTGWSETIIEHLREELYGQMNRLEPIQKEIMQKQNSTMGDTTDLHLRKYYFTLGQYLKSKEHNSAVHSSQSHHHFPLYAQRPPVVPSPVGSRPPPVSPLCTTSLSCLPIAKNPISPAVVHFSSELPGTQITQGLIPTARFKLDLNS